MGGVRGWRLPWVARLDRENMHYQELEWGAALSPSPVGGRYGSWCPSDGVPKC
jgi:hypothetical protein